MGHLEQCVRSPSNTSGNDFQSLFSRHIKWTYGLVNFSFDCPLIEQQEEMTLV